MKKQKTNLQIAEEQENHFTKLPDEIISQVVNFLDVKSSLNLIKTSRLFYPTCTLHLKKIRLERDINKMMTEETLAGITQIATVLLHPSQYKYELTEDKENGGKKFVISKIISLDSVNSTEDLSLLCSNDESLSETIRTVAQELTIVCKGPLKLMEEVTHYLSKDVGGCFSDFSENFQERYNSFKAFFENFTQPAIENNVIDEEIKEDTGPKVALK